MHQRQRGCFYQQIVDPFSKFILSNLDKIKTDILPNSGENLINLNIYTLLKTKVSGGFKKSHEISGSMRNHQQWVKKHHET